MKKYAGYQSKNISWFCPFYAGSIDNVKTSKPMFYGLSSWGIITITLYIHIFSDFGYLSSLGHPRGPTVRFITPDEYVIKNNFTISQPKHTVGTRMNFQNETVLLATK